MILLAKLSIFISETEDMKGKSLEKHREKNKRKGEQRRKHEDDAQICMMNGLTGVINDIKESFYSFIPVNCTHCGCCWFCCIFQRLFGSI